MDQHEIKDGLWQLRQTVALKREDTVVVYLPTRKELKARYYGKTTKEDKA